MMTSFFITPNTVR